MRAWHSKENIDESSTGWPAPEHRRIVGDLERAEPGRRAAGRRGRAGRPLGSGPDRHAPRRAGNAAGAWVASGKWGGSPGARRGAARVDRPQRASGRGGMADADLRGGRAGPGVCRAQPGWRRCLSPRRVGRPRLHPDPGREHAFSANPDGNVGAAGMPRSPTAGVAGPDRGAGPGGGRHGDGRWRQFLRQRIGRVRLQRR